MRAFTRGTLLNAPMRPSLSASLGCSALLLHHRDGHHPWFFSRKKRQLFEQVCAWKQEAENARKIAREDVEKAKRYGIASFGRDIIDVLDTLEKGMSAFEWHRERYTSASNGSVREEGTHPAKGEGDHNGSSPEALRGAGTRDSPSSASSPEQKSLESIFTGVKLATKVLEKHLSKHGIVKIPVEKGDVFDPYRHDALSSTAATPDCPPETIVEVLKTGYWIQEDRVLRPAQVIVAVDIPKKEKMLPEGATEEADQQEEIQNAPGNSSSNE